MQVPASVPTVMATAVPSDEEMAAAMQRAECDAAIAHLDSARAAYDLSLIHI